MLRLLIRRFKRFFKYIIVFLTSYIILQSYYSAHVPDVKLNQQDPMPAVIGKRDIENEEQRIEPGEQIPAEPSNISHVNLPIKKANACLFVLVRNKELKEWIKTMKQFEENFNQKYQYPYIFMNNEPFTDEFKSSVLNETNAFVEFGLVPKEHWSIPSWIDTNELANKMNTSLNKMFRGKIMSYHHMCRYYSGFFFRHDLTLKYDYFWRLEPKVSFPCKIEQDPFMTLILNNKLFGFSIARPEMMDTIPSLWNTIKKWIKEFDYAKEIPSDNAIGFISSDNGVTIDEKACTFYNNFEIGSFAVFRHRNYLDYFEYLDKTGGFFYERWGDSAINTFYLVLMLRRNQLHIFDNIAYFHPPRYYCPEKPTSSCKCKMPKKGLSSYKRCFDKWNRVINPPKYSNN